MENRGYVIFKYLLLAAAVCGVCYVPLMAIDGSGSEAKRQDPGRPVGASGGVSSDEEMRILQQSLDAASALGKLAREYLKANEPERAEDAVLTALAIVPMIPGMRELHAEALMRQGKDSEALAVFDAIVSLPEDGARTAGVWYTEMRSADQARKGFLLAKAGRIEESLKLWHGLATEVTRAARSSEALTTPEGSDPLAAWTLAIALLEDGRRPDFALHYYEKAHELAPQNSLVNWRLGSHYLKSGALDKAATHFEAARSGPDDIKAWAEQLLRSIRRDNRT